MAAGVKRKLVGDAAVTYKRTHIETELPTVSASASATATPTSPPSNTFSDHQNADAASVTSRATTQRPKKYLCEYEGCTKAFDRPVRLQAHIRTHTDDRTFVCDEPDCTKSFYKAEHLKAHWQNKHSNDASHVCTYVLSTDNEGTAQECGKAFTTASRLRRHLAIHEEREQTKCQEPGCGKIFRKQETLQRHIKKDHFKENAFRCDHVLEDKANREGGISEECGETFATVGQLKAHKNREHTGPKYFCDVCPASVLGGLQSMRAGFETWAGLQFHNKTVHPPTCATCGQVCETSRALSAHIEIEHCALSDRQKFFCPHEGCGRGFTRKGNLSVHVQTVHGKVRKFVCGQFDLTSDPKCPGWDQHGCGMGFSTKANMVNHVRTQHLDLPLLNRKVMIKVEDALPSGALDTQTNAISLLTGAGYEDARPIECWNSSCSRRFQRDYDLAQHMEIEHEWNVDDINDRFTEIEALHGGKFWVGGQMGESRQEREDPDDEALRWELQRALQAQQIEEVSAHNGESREGQLDRTVKSSDMAIDPALISTTEG